MSHKASDGREKISLMAVTCSHAGWTQLEQLLGKGPVKIMGRRLLNMGLHALSGGAAPGERLRIPVAVTLPNGSPRGLSDLLA